MTLLLASLAVLAFGGVLAAALSRWPRAASWAGSAAAVIGCVGGAVFAARGLGGETARVEIGWRVPSGAIVLAIDTLSAFFLMPVFVLGALAAIYGRSYLLVYRDHKALGPPWLAFNVLLASMAVVVTARHAVLFLVAWEIMSLAAYVLVAFEHEQAEARRAGWVYLIAAHAGTAVLIAMFVVLGSTTGTFDLGASTAVDPRMRPFVALLALVGFGVKAGIVPLHVWLPEAHAAAPSHVSAVLSGVLTKMGVYGIVRFVVMLGPAPAWWGTLLMVLGLTGALFGIALASHQRDLKRALAYSTIENVGLVLLGLGLGLWGAAKNHPLLAALGLLGGLMHVWNHTAMKGLLFLGAGTIVHAAGSKDVEKLGGLLRRTPIAGALFIAGAVAIAGLPPLNGFAGEWLLYRSLLDGAVSGAPGSSIGFMLAVGAVSATSALAALCFVRLCSSALLGEPRSAQAASAHEAGPGMLLPMGVLALACALVGAWPGVALRPILGVAATIAPLDPTAVASTQSSLGAVGGIAMGLWGCVVIAALCALAFVRGQRGSERPTWDCGYAAPTARMQYTASSFAQLLTQIVPRTLRPKAAVARPEGLFPRPGEFQARSEDPVTHAVYEPFLQRAADRFAKLRWLQQGALHIYLLYILVAVVAALAWASVGSQGG